MGFWRRESPEARFRRLWPVEDGMVVRDLACQQCGYNLRTTAADGNCSECGTSVAASRPLFMADSRTLRRLRLGAALLVLALALALVVPWLTALASPPADARPGWQPPAHVGEVVLGPDFLVSPFHLATHQLGMIAGFIAAMLLTTPIRLAPPPGAERLRRLLRGLGFLLVLQIALDVTAKWHRPTWTNYFVWVGLDAAYPLVMFVGALYLRSLARRVPHSPARRCAATLALLAVSIGAAEALRTGVVAYVIHPIIQLRMVRHATPALPRNSRSPPDAPAYYVVDPRGTWTGATTVPAELLDRLVRHTFRERSVAKSIWNRLARAVEWPIYWSLFGWHVAVAIFAAFLWVVLTRTLDDHRLARSLAASRSAPEHHSYAPSGSANSA